MRACTEITSGQRSNRPASPSASITPDARIAYARGKEMRGPIAAQLNRRTEERITPLAGLQAEPGQRFAGLGDAAFTKVRSQ